MVIHGECDHSASCKVGLIIAPFRTEVVHTVVPMMILVKHPCHITDRIAVPTCITQVLYFQIVQVEATGTCSSNYSMSATIMQ